MTRTPPTLQERRAAATTLSPAEARIADFLASNPQEAAFLSAAQIAEQLQVSNATVVRTAQKLGYSGLPELREQARQAIRAQTGPSARLGRALDEMGNREEIPVALFGSYIRLLEAAQQSIRPDDFGRAVDLLAAADRTVIFARSQHSGLAQYFRTGLRRFGYRALTIVDYPNEAVEDLLELGPGDVLLVVAYEFASTIVQVPIDHAWSKGVPVVLITDDLALVFEGRYSVALSAQRSASSTFPTGLIPLAVLEALLFAIADRDRDRAIATTESRAKLWAELTE